jgi:hypothetical protein
LNSNTPKHTLKKQTMKTPFFRFVLAASLAALPGLLQAQPSAHYVPGSEGIDAATLPPPGLYFRDYTFFYTSDQFNNASGHNAGVPNFDAFTYANIPRVIWISDYQLLGGNVGVDALLPIAYQHVSAGGFNDGTFGIGDFFAESTLSWHPKQFDFAVGAGFWAPTGDSSAPPTTRIGLGYWTCMLTAGATWYIDEDKTWAVSALNRYEFNSEQDDTHITPGEAYTLEWGVSKKLMKIIDVGAVGYYQQQVTANSGASDSSRNRVAAVGPEISAAFPKYMFFVSLRYLYEFMAEDRAQGQAVTLTLTKRF